MSIVITYVYNCINFLSLIVER